MPPSKRKSASSSSTQTQQQRQRVQESNANPAARPAQSTVSSTASTGPSPPPAPKVNGRYLVNVFDHIIKSVPSYKDKWFTVDDWCSVFPTYWGLLKGHEGLVTKAIPAFNREMKNMRTYGGVDAQTKYFENNKYGVFSNEYEFKNEEGVKSKKSCYLFTDKESKCPLPPPAVGFKPTNINEIHVSPRTAEAATVGMPTPSPSTTTTNIRGIANPSENRPSGTSVTASTANPSETAAETPSPLSQSNPAAALNFEKYSDKVRNLTYWDDGRAWLLFMPKSANKEDYNDRKAAILSAIDARIEICRMGMKQSPDNSQSWHLAVEGAKIDDDITEVQKERIRYKCRYLYIALIKARQDMTGGIVTWKDCTTHAIVLMKATGSDYIGDAETIQEWHMMLRENDDMFAHPNPQIAAGEISEPLFFIENPRAKIAFLQYADELAATAKLTGQAMYEYTNGTLVENALAEQNNNINQQDNNTQPMIRADFLRLFGLLKGRPPASDTLDDDDEVTRDVPPPNENISHGTIVRWMNLYDFRYDVARKHFYNDTHEDPMTIADRERFILRYLFQYEPRTHRWIQVPKADAEVMRQNNNVPDYSGYEYMGSDGKEYVEFHVDDCQSFSKAMNKTEEYGGKRSTLFINAPTDLINQWAEDGMFEDEIKPSKAGYKYTSLAGVPMTEVHALQFQDDDDTRNKLKQCMQTHNLFFSFSVRPALLLFGQDEAIFKQFIMRLKIWLGRGGKQPLMPKDDGIGMMASAMKNRDFGFKMKLTQEMLIVVNKFRREQRPNYADRAAAKKVYGSETSKPALKSSPFLTLFDYGKNAEGYWTYDRMISQLEDCHDVLDALYSERATGQPIQQHMTKVPGTINPFVRKFDYAWLFDHSCGHDRKRPDGLDVNGLTKGPSPNAKLMRTTLIYSAKLLGKFVHDKKLKVGDMQKMGFEDLDNFGGEESGPVASDSKCKGKYDKVSGTKDVEMVRDELAAVLAEKGLLASGTKPILVARCQQAGIPVTKKVKNVIEMGWHGKTKGVLQILWERGWIDPENMAKYTMHGPKDKNQNVQKQYSLNHLIRQCEDFVHEKTLLQYYGEELGSIIDRSPKCTPEVAGDGIEFDWAMAKLWYRMQPLEKKKTKDNFKKLVEEALSENVLSLERTRHFSKRARMNMISYYRLSRDGKSSTPSDVNTFKAKSKSHTNILDKQHRLFSPMVRALIAQSKA